MSMRRPKDRSASRSSAPAVPTLSFSTGKCLASMARAFVRMVRSPETFPYPRVPIIMLTGHGERSRVIEAVKVGVNEFLVKPVSSKALQDRLIAVLVNPRPLVKTGDYYGPAPRKMASFCQCRQRRDHRQPVHCELSSALLSATSNLAARGRRLAAALIAIDQGTTSTRAIAFDAALKPLASPSTNCTRSIRRPAWSSTIRKRSGPHRRLRARSDCQGRP